MTHRAYIVTLGLAALLVGAGCSRIKTTVEIYRGQLPTQEFRARERHLDAQEFVTSALQQLAPTRAALESRCESLNRVRAREDEHQREFKQDFSAKSPPKSVEPLLTAITECLASQYDPARCAAVVVEKKALADLGKSDWVAEVIARVVAAHPETAQVKPDARSKGQSTQTTHPRAAVEAVVIAIHAGQDPAEAHKAYRSSLPAEFKLAVQDWHAATSRVGVEVLPVLATLEEACQTQKSALIKLESDLKTYQSRLEALEVPKANPADPSRTATGQLLTEAKRDYAIVVHATVDSLQSLRMRLIAAGKATAERITAAVTVLGANAKPDPTRGLAVDRALESDVRVLVKIADEALQFKADPRDQNLATITDRANRRLWNRVDVDRMVVRASGRSRHIVVQDSPINFRLKELNSDPTAVVKFGLTAADVGLEVLNAVLTKGAIGGDGGEDDADETALNADDRQQLSRDIAENVDAARKDLQKALTEIEGLAKAANPDLPALRARLEGLLKKHQEDLAQEAKRGVSP